MSRIVTTGMHINKNGPESTPRPILDNIYMLFKLNCLRKTYVSRRCTYHELAFALV